MKRSYKKIITALDNLSKIWDDDLVLVSDGGALLVIHYKTKEVLANILGIHNDGGDAGTYIVGEKEYWDID